MKKGIVLLSIFLFFTFVGYGFASTLLYTQNFESPNLTQYNLNTGGQDASLTNVNSIYANQPPGFSFAQQYTVETLFVGGTVAHGGTGFVDPQNKAGSYVLGMLSHNQNDLLGLSFDIGTYDFLNFQLDISSIDLNFWGGPFVPADGLAPTFRLSLYDNPSGTTGLFGNSVLLDSIDITGNLSALKNTFDWTNHIVGLDAKGNTNGNVILQIDELIGGYAALDNFKIVASNTQGDIGDIGSQIPEPGTMFLFGLGLLGVAGVSRRKK